jgi:peptide/nickel transport system substrate-binding protein
MTRTSDRSSLGRSSRPLAATTAALPPGLVFGRALTRRDLMWAGAGLAGAVAIGSSLRLAVAQDGGPAILFQGEGEPPTEAAGELRMALQFDPQNLDPAATYTLNNGRWQKNVYSPLTWRDENLVLYDGQDGRPTPDQGYGLAASWEYLDDVTLRMTLKTGITFHNGEALTAQSVKATYDRMLAEDSTSPQAFNYATIESVEVVDDTTVIFHFNTVDPVMPVKMAGYGSFIVPADGSSEANFGTEIAYGTGPYRVVEYVKDDHLTLEAIDNFWGGQNALIKTINMRIIPDDNTRLSEFLAGSIDVLTLNPTQVPAIQGNPDLSMVEIGVPTVSGLRLDAAQAPTDNVEVRRAIAHAIDLQTIIDTILGGYATPVGVWQSPFSFGFEELPPYGYDPAVAAEHLAASGLPTPVKVIYSVIGQDSQELEFAQAVKGMLDAVGFETELQVHEQATYFDDYRVGALGNIVPFGWGGWTLDFDNTYFSMYKTGESYNPSYSNPEVDSLLEQQRATLDAAERLEIAKQLNQLIYEDAPDVALYQEKYIWGVNNKVHHFLVPPDERLFWLGSWITE